MHTAADMHGRMDSTSQNANYLDPTTTERRIYRERTTGIEREIWRPGDGEGDLGTDYFDRAGPPLPLDQCWRLFQVSARISKMPSGFRTIVATDRLLWPERDSGMPSQKT